MAGNRDLDIPAIRDELRQRLKKALAAETARLTFERRKTTKHEVRIAAEALARRFTTEVSFDYGVDLGGNLLRAAAEDAAWHLKMAGGVTSSMAFYVMATLNFRPSQ